MVGAVRAGGDAAIGPALRQKVAVEQDRLFAVPVLPAEKRVLAARHEPGVIGKRPVGSRRRRVVFLDSGAHLLRQPLLQAAQRFHDRFGVLVLGLQMPADILGQNGGVAHRLLPVLRAQPGIGVGALLPVLGDAVRPPLRARRAGGAVSLADPGESPQRFLADMVLDTLGVAPGGLVADTDGLQEVQHDLVAPARAQRHLPALAGQED